MFTFINKIEDLEFLNRELVYKECIGVDTEFKRTSKDNMKLALLQINDGEEIYLIDAIAIKNPEENVSFLFSKSVTKIFHSCKEDLEAIYAWTNKKMTNIFDTQIANAFLDGNFSISYQGLVEEMLGITLEKKETRSNWMRRPLTDSQLKYASLDVEYLIYIYLEQKEQLSQSSKLKWLYQDIERLISLTFDQISIPSDLKRTITRGQEAALLVDLNKLVEIVSKEEKINPTLLLSKKAQKEYLRLIFTKGLDQSLHYLTNWRQELLKKGLLNLLK